MQEMVWDESVGEEYEESGNSTIDEGKMKEAV
jgi:hypothetical protein